MGKFRSIALATGLAFVLSLGSYAQESNKERIIRLDSHLRAIQAEARSGRLIGGWVLLGSGLGLGGSFIAIGATLDGAEDYDLDTFFYVMGTSLGLSLAIPGAVILAIPSEAETLPASFFRLPEEDAEDRALKVAAGESILDSLAEKGRTGRFWSGGLGLGFGAYFLAAGGAFDRYWPGLSNRLLPALNGGYPSDPYAMDTRSSYLYEGLVLAGTGLLTFAFPTRAERERTAYRNRYPQEGQQVLPWFSLEAEGPTLGIALAY